MSKNFKRFLTALMTLLFIAPSYSALAADVPTDLKIFGYKVNGQEWQQISCNSKDGSRFYFDVSLTDNKVFKFIDQAGNEWGPGTENDKTIFYNTNYELKKGSKAYQLDYGATTAFMITVDFSGDTPLIKVGLKSDGNYPVIEQPKPATCPDALYLIGHVKGYGQWGGPNMPGTKAGNKFYFKDVEFSGYSNWADGARSVFGFSLVGDGKGDKYYATGDAKDTDAKLGSKTDMTLQTAGGWAVYGQNKKYDIVVDFTDPANPYFIITEQAEAIVPGVVPETFYIFGNIEGENGWNGTGKPVAFTSRDEEAGTITFSGVQLDGSFAFCSQEGANGDECKGHDGYLGSNLSEGDLSVNAGTKYSLYSKTGHGFLPTAGTYDVVVYFPAEGDPYFIMKAVDVWYFVGDLNNWYSYEFTDLDKDSSKTINADLFYQTRKNWKFVPAKDETLAAEGWYQFSNFPMVDGVPTLSGQFKIKDGQARWSGNEYVHPNYVKYANDDNYRNYISSPLPASEINSGEPFTGTVLVKRGENGDRAGNLHLQSNAVRNAVIYFNPDLRGAPALRIDGTPVDYFIFYSRDKEEGYEDKVVGKVSDGKPNQNNYYLPGTSANDVTLENYPADVEHMNTGNGKTFTKIDLKGKSADQILDALKAAFPTVYDYSTINQAVFDNIANKKILPNMESLEDRDYLYIEKIPTGFESPAGVHFNMTLTSALEGDSKKIPSMLSTEHIYFLPVGKAVHVHVNYDSMKGKYEDYGEPVVSYRVYYTSTDYVCYVIGNTDMWPGTETDQPYKISSGSNIYETGSDKDPYVSDQWVVLKDYKDHSEWGVTEPYEYKDKKYTKWNVNYVQADGLSSDSRLGIRSRYANSYVQFRVEIPHNTDPSKTIVNYFPARLDVANDDNHYPIGGKDLYVVMENDSDNGVWTGVEDIEIDSWYGDAAEEDPEAVFYNLQGVRVANPSDGIFIMVKGGKSRKVYIK